MPQVELRALKHPALPAGTVFIARTGDDSLVCYDSTMPPSEAVAQAAALPLLRDTESDWLEQMSRLLGSA